MPVSAGDLGRGASTSTLGAADPELLYADLVFPAGPDDRPFVAVNMVSTVDGKIRIGPNPALIGSSLDKTLLRRIRAAADGVMHGAETIRLENVGTRLPPELAARRLALGLAARPRPVVVTRSGNLPLAKRYFTDAEPSAIVLAPIDLPAATARAIAQGCHLIQTGVGEVDLVAAMRELRQAIGLRHVVLEGGPNLNFRMLARGLVDELFWTVAPKIVGGEADLSLVAGAGYAQGAWASLDLVSVAAHASELYARYRVTDGDAAKPA